MVVIVAPAKVNVVVLGIVAMTIGVFGGFVTSPVPLTTMPMLSPAVPAHVTVVPLTVQPVSDTPAAVSDTDAPLLVGTVALSTRDVALVTVWIVVPVGMKVPAIFPLMLMPGINPVVVVAPVQVTVAEPSVVQVARTIGTV